MPISPLKNLCGISKLRRFSTMKLSITIQRQAVGTLLPGDALCLKQPCPVSGWSQLNVSFCKTWPVEFLLVCVFCFRLFTCVLSTRECKGSVYQPVVRYSIRLSNDWLQSSWQVCEQRKQAAHPCSLSWPGPLQKLLSMPSCSTAALGTEQLARKQTGKRIDLDFFFGGESFIAASITIHIIGVITWFFIRSF